MDISWNDIEVFLAVAETGSFSSAAKRLRRGQPTISRRVAQMEEQVGHALFLRGVDGALLTEAGNRLLPAAQRMAESAGDITRLLSHGETSPAGRVRIAAPPGIAFDFLAPFCAYAQDVLPDIRIELLSGIPYVDLVRHEADLAIRTQAPTQRELTALCALRVPAVAWATPEYIARLPKKPKVSDVDWITWAPPYDRLPPRPQLEKLIEGFDPIFSSDSYLIQKRAAESGVGGMFLGGVTHRFQADSPLVPLPFSFDYVGVMYLVCAKAMRGVPRVNAVLELLIDELEAAKGGHFERLV